MFANRVVADAVPAKRDEVVAFVAKRFVDEARVVKRFVPVALPKKKVLMRPLLAKKLVVVAFVVVELMAERFTREVEPKAVSMAKTEVEAALRTLNARPLIGVWMVVVAP